MLWHKINDIFQYIMIIVVGYFMSPTNNLFLNMLTIDSLISAINYIKNHINNNLTDSQVIDKSSQIFTSSMIDRYIYYGLAYIAYNIICNIFWITNIKSLYSLLLLTLTPYIINYIQRSSLFNIIRKKKEKIIKMIISKQIILFFKITSKIYLKKEIKIDSNEILYMFDDYKNTINGCKEIIKNTLIILLLLYIKKSTGGLCYNTIKRMYNYKTGDILESFNEESAKEKLLIMINNKQWNEIFKPNVYKALIHLYEIRADNSDFIKYNFKEFNNNVCKMICVWTLSSFFNMINVIPIMSIGMLIYRKNTRVLNLKFLYKIIMILVGWIIGLSTNSFLLTSLISHFGYTLILNKIIESIMNYFYCEIKKRILYFIDLNKEQNITFMATYIYVNICHNLISNNNHLLFNLLYIVFINDSIPKNMIYLTTIFTGLHSEFNQLHIIHNLLLLYILMANINSKNLFDLLNITKNKYWDIIAAISKNNNNTADKYIQDFYELESRNDIQNINHNINDTVNINYNTNNIQDIDHNINNIQDINHNINDNQDMDHVNNIQNINHINNKKDECNEIIDNKSSISIINDEIFDLDDDNFFNEIAVKNDNIYKNDSITKIIENYY